MVPVSAQDTGYTIIRDEKVPHVGKIRYTQNTRNTTVPSTASRAGVRERPIPRREEPVISYMPARNRNGIP